MKRLRMIYYRAVLKLSLRIKLWLALRRKRGSGLERFVEALEWVERRYDINIE